MSRLVKLPLLYNISIYYVFVSKGLIYTIYRGGLLGLRLVAAFPFGFAGLIISNTGLPDGKGIGATDGFKQWLEFSQNVPYFDVSKIISKGMDKKMTKEELAAYDAPFPSDEYKGAARFFPTMVPITPQHPSAKE